MGLKTWNAGGCNAHLTKIPCLMACGVAALAVFAAAAVHEVDAEVPIAPTHETRRGPSMGKRTARSNHEQQTL